MRVEWRPTALKHHFELVYQRTQLALIYYDGNKWVSRVGGVSKMFDGAFDAQDDAHERVVAALNRARTRSTRMIDEADDVEQTGDYVEV